MWLSDLQRLGVPMLADHTWLAEVWLSQLAATRVAALGVVLPDSPGIADYLCRYLEQLVASQPSLALRCFTSVDEAHQWTTAEAGS